MSTDDQFEVRVDKRQRYTVIAPASASGTAGRVYVHPAQTQSHARDAANNER